VDASTGEARVVGAKQADLLWMRDAAKSFEYKLKRDGYTLTARGHLMAVTASRSDRKAAPESHGTINLSIDVEAPNHHSSLGTSFTGTMWHMDGISTGEARTSPVFAVPSISSSPMVFASSRPSPRTTR